MNGKIPHIVQYQGSKRVLASKILQFMPQRFNRCIEPFAGSAAISIAAAINKNVDSFVINDINEPLIKLLMEAINNPEDLYIEYKKIWEEQFTSDHIEHFYRIRENFNSGNRTAANMLYILARCVKGAVRYSSEGKFNQSPDKRRHGTKPETILKNCLLISNHLKGKTRFYSLDYREILSFTKPGDVVYMDPPYQGTSKIKDSRYLSGVSFEEFVESLYELNDRKIDFIVSYDGFCGSKLYGYSIPEDLECEHILLNAGRSSQATLLGRQEVTYESLYISKNLKMQNYS